MRISFVLPPANLSGGIRVVAIYADRLRAGGHQVTLVSSARPRPPRRQRLKTWLRAGARPVAAVGKSHLDGLSLDHRVMDRPGPIGADDLPDADVVIATWWETAEWVAALPPGKGAKVYFIQHHEVFHNLPVQRVRATYRLPLRHVTISQWLVDTLREEYASDPVLVPNGVDPAQFHAPPRSRRPSPTVGMLYSHSAFKGCGATLEALHRVKREFPDLRLVTFGAEPAGPPLALPTWAEHHVKPAQDRIRDLYAACDVFVCGSRSEGFGLPPLEAMACRCPVVSTRVGWPMESIRDGENGYLVDIDDGPAMADRIARVLRLDDAAWRRMSDAAYATAGSYTWDRSADLFERALLAAVRAERGPKESPAMKVSP